MKKTLLLFCCTLIMTGLLFFSGTYILDLVALSDVIPDQQAADGGEDWQAEPGASGYHTGVPGFSFFQPFDARTVDGFVDVLRTFRQDTGGPINILMLASDAGVNTDAIMVMRFNPKTSQINIISIPRDTYITLKGYKFHKINSVYTVKNGITQLISLLESMLGQRIDYFVHLDLKTIREIVDLLDGVEYDVPCDMVYKDPDQKLDINLKQGRRTLTGKQVEGLLRFRHPNKWTKEVKKFYDGSDLKRIERQHDFFNEMLKQKLNIKYASKSGDIISTIYSNITTDLPLSEMLKLARGLPSLSSDKFRTATLPGYAKTIGGLSYFIHDPAQTITLAESMLGESES